MKQEFYEKLSKIVRKEQILEEEPMKKHTTFRIGGPAEYLILPQTYRRDCRCDYAVPDRKR